MIKVQDKLSSNFSKALATGVSNTILIIFSLSCIFPVIWLAYSSFKSQREFSQSIIALPQALNIDHYKYIFTKTEMPRYFLNSINVTVVSLVITILVGFILGYFFARFEFKGKHFLYNYLLVGMLVPIHALMVPMYIIFKKFGLSDQWFTLIIPYIAFGIPVTMFLINSYVKSLPREMEQAAAIDGASFTRTLFSIIFPMCKPIVVTVAIIQFFACWNEFSFGLILINSPKLRTIPVGITLLKGQFTADYPRMMSVMVAAILPAMIIYFIFSKQIMKSMVSGAVKG